MAAWLVAIELALVLAAGPASGQAADAWAREHYENGARQYQAGAVREALHEFETAYALVPHPRLLFNLGQCHRRLGQTTEAIRAYRAYLREVPEAANRSEVEALIEAMVRQAAAAEGAPHKPGVPGGAHRVPEHPRPAAGAPAGTAFAASHERAALSAREGASLPMPDGGLLQPTLLDPPARRPFYAKRWFWVAAASVVLIGAGVATWAATDGPSKPPCDNPVVCAGNF